MTKSTEATITLCDALNPACGYQVRITRDGHELLFTCRNPATGEELLTYEQCLDVLVMYASPGYSSSYTIG